MVICEKNKCTGCGACSQICPQKCIMMKEDIDGFLYPEIDNNVCINCNKCIHTCPVLHYQNEVITGGGYIEAYGGWHNNDSIRYNSSSGGAFSLLADSIIEQGGIVFGCTLNEKMKAVHICVDNKEELWKLRGSKYVQSEIRSTYNDVKQNLELGRKVLFVGTPCQVAGLSAYLEEKEYSNLYKVDFICHGVPSPKVFAGYLEYLENTYNSKIISFKFRNKDYGWNPNIQLGTEIQFENGTRIRNYPAFKDSYMNGFSNDIFLRPSCYECSFKKNFKKYSDFTIADFWGVNQISKKLNDGKGTSLILICNEHANLLWDEIKKDFYFEKVDYKKAIQRNKSIVYSADRNPKRRKFLDDFNTKGYNYVKHKYLSTHLWIINKLIKIGRSYYTKMLGN